MKKHRQVPGFAPSVGLVSAVLAALFISLLPSSAENEKIEMKDFAKNAHPGAIVVFSEEDIIQNTVSKQTPSALLISGLPHSDVGTLCLNEKVLCEGNIIPADEIGGLVFTPGTQNEFSAELCFLPLSSADSISLGGSPITVTLNFSLTPNSPPLPASLALETYKNMPLEIDLSAYDHDGDPVSYHIVSQSGNGTLELVNGRLIFTPDADSTGKFGITFYAKDSVGNTSGLTKTTVSVSKNRSNISYADITDPAREYYAVRLAESGVFYGERYGDTATLTSERSFSKMEFSVLCAAALDLSVESTAEFSMTGVPVWQTPYLSTAVSAGTFDDSDVLSPVTARSAAFIALELLEEKLGRDISADSLGFARECGIISSGMSPDTKLSREEALEMICKTMDVFSGKKHGWRGLE